MQKKYEKLKSIIKKMKEVLIAYSGGVDSTFLTRVAFDVLGKDNVLAVTVNSSIRFQQGIEKAETIAEEMGVKHLLIKTDELENNEFAGNNKLRCYHCKVNLFSELRKIAEEHNIEFVLDGTNADDISGGHRPGLRAKKELDIRSPLEEAGLTKQEIRKLSRELDLPTWNQPSDTCLATRFAYGIDINEDRLEKLRKIELYIRTLNLRQLRVRLHDLSTIRLEVLPEEMDIIMKNREQIVEKIKEMDYNYITLDLQGYRSGSMDELMEGDK